MEGGGTWPPIAGGVPGSAAPMGMAQAGDASAGGGAPPGAVDPMMLLAMAKLARGSKIRNQQRNKSKSKARRK